MQVWHQPPFLWRADIENLGPVLFGSPPGRILARGESQYAAPEVTALREVHAMAAHLRLRDLLQVGYSLITIGASSFEVLGFKGANSRGRNYTLTTLKDTGFVVRVVGTRNPPVIEPLGLITDQDLDTSLFDVSWPS
jgi:hypothetical protein